MSTPTNGDAIDIPKRVGRALATITEWMEANGAGKNAENLAPGATEEALAEVALALGPGASLPVDLRALWLLHDGQRSEGSGFVESHDLLSTRDALRCRETLMLGLEFAREAPQRWLAQGGTHAELATDQWLPFAARDSDCDAVCLVSGRVFSCPHDDDFRVVHESLVAWLEGYAARVVADDYRVERGFGGVYLVVRDRKAEAWAAEGRRQAEIFEAYLRDTPLDAQMSDAIAKRDTGRAMDVIRDGLGTGDAPLVARLVDALFAHLDASEGPSRRDRLTFLAGSLRPHMRAITLPPDRWVDVALGGALLANNAIKDTAAARAKGLSQDRHGALVKATSEGEQSMKDAAAAVVAKIERPGG